MITIATKSMIPALKSIWIDAFKDPEAYADFFLNHRFNDISTFVYLIENNPVSMAFVFNEEICYKGSYVKAGYIYGVATASKHQGKGYSTEVLRHIQGIYPTTFLVPATQRLFDFYGRNGYKTAFTVIEETLIATSEHSLVETPYSFCAISSAQYKGIRDNHFQREGYVRWSESSIAYAIAENQFLGGSTLKVSFLNQSKSTCEAIVLYRCYENQLYIKETTLSGQNLYDVALLLMKKNHVTKCHLRLATDQTSTGQGFGMLHSTFSLENGYCNLVLD